MELFYKDLIYLSLYLFCFNYFNFLLFILESAHAQASGGGSEGERQADSPSVEPVVGLRLRTLTSPLEPAPRVGCSSDGAAQVPLTDGAFSSSGMFSAAACPPSALLRVRGFIFAVWGPQGYTRWALPPPVPQHPACLGSCRHSSTPPGAGRPPAPPLNLCSFWISRRTTCLSAYRAFGGGAILVGAGGSAWTWLAVPPPQLLLMGKIHAAARQEHRRSTPFLPVVLDMSSMLSSFTYFCDLSLKI